MPRYVLVMENALVIGATGGIGRAVVADLQARGVAVTTLGRVDGLDVTEPGSVDRVLGAVAGPFDLIFVAIGILAVPGDAPFDRTVDGGRSTGRREVEL